MTFLARRLTNYWYKLRESDTFKSGFWVLFGLGFSLVVRFGSNIVLTKLLVPEYFGIMALMYTILQFVSMISDIGLVPSIINTKRHDDERFMRTAWTLQVIRSTLIGIAVMLVAYPMSHIYEQPQLFPLTIVAGITMMIMGFSSTAPLVEQKFLRQKTIVISQAVAQVLSTGLMIGLAFYFKSVWVLLSGYIISELAKFVFSYALFHKHHSKFAIEKAAISEIIRFGRWIFIASIIAYFATRMDILVLGKLISVEALGVYSIAAMFAGMLENIANKLSVQVLHPRYRQLVGEKVGFSAIYSARHRFNLLCAAACILLAWFGDVLIHIAYDERYMDAGWMLQILVLGTVSRFLSSSLRSLLNAVGDSFSTMIYQILYTLVIGAAMWVGFSHMNTLGIILAIAITPIIMHPILIMLALRHKFNCVKNDLLIVVGSAALIVIGWFALDSATIDVLKQHFSPAASVYTRLNIFEMG